MCYSLLELVIHRWRSHNENQEISKSLFNRFYCSLRGEFNRGFSLEPDFPWTGIFRLGDATPVCNSTRNYPANHWGY